MRKILDRLRPSVKEVSLAVALLVVALALIIQAGAARDTRAYSQMRRDDLVALLAGLTSETEKLNEEVAQLERAHEELASGEAAQASEQAQRRRDSIDILAGVVPTSGPGIRMTIEADAISPDLVLDAVQELRDAGAEVIEINDSVRLVASSWFAQDNGNLVVDGVVIDQPLVIDAIGDSHALGEAMKFRGGVVSQVEGDRVKGHVDIATLDNVEISSVREVESPRHAEPA